VRSVGISLKELGGRSDVEMFEILHRDWNLKQIFTQKWESVDVNWGGFNSNPPTISTLLVRRRTYSPRACMSPVQPPTSIRYHLLGAAHYRTAVAVVNIVDESIRQHIARVRARLVLGGIAADADRPRPRLESNSDEEVLPLDWSDHGRWRWTRSSWETFNSDSSGSTINRRG